MRRVVRLVPGTRGSAQLESPRQPPNGKSPSILHSPGNPTYAPIRIRFGSETHRAEVLFKRERSSLEFPDPGTRETPVLLPKARSPLTRSIAARVNHGC